MIVYQKVFKYSRIVIFTALVIYLACTWNQIPAMIGNHFNEYGVVNGSGSKLSLLTYPLILLGLVILGNYGCNTIMMKLMVYQPKKCEAIEATLHCTLETLLLLLTTMVSYMIYRSATQQMLGSWFVLMLLGGSLIMIIGGCVISYHKWRKCK